MLNFSVLGALGLERFLPLYDFRFFGESGFYVSWGIGF